MRPAKVRVRKPRQSFIDGNESGSGGLDQYAERARYRETPRTGHAGARTLVNEQKIGVNLPGKLDGLPLSTVQSRPFVLESREGNLPDRDPGRKPPRPPANDVGRSFSLQFADDRIGND
ncbi:MAG: hypothetical protein M3Y07_03740 [Acidobacteriota bacterium]|nr:hypothetical protein [Acidobacteriota bacterium]